MVVYLVSPSVIVVRDGQYQASKPNIPNKKFFI